MAGEVQVTASKVSRFSLFKKLLELDPLPGVRLANQPERRALDTMSGWL